MKYDLVIFDLDGTLLDTLADLRESVNHALAARGWGTRSLEEVRAYVGSGVRTLFERALPGAPEREISDCVEHFKAHYRANVDVFTRPYPGVCPLLERLKKAGIGRVVCSNKFDAAVQMLCARHFGDLVDACLGEGPDMAKKPAPDGCLRLMRERNVSPSRTLYVGDSDVDVQTAANAGISGAFVTWGFRDRICLETAGAKHIFDDAEALGDYILG